jgi:predicted dehydrogenase
MEIIRWGIIGCGNVTEVKSGPGFQKAARSQLTAVVRRDRVKAEDYARRHGIPRFYSNAGELIHDPEVDAVYVATPPSTHLPLALQVAETGKPCLVEKPMALNHQECLHMVEAFRLKGAPLFVAYYRRALPRFLKVRDLLGVGAIGRLTSVHIVHYEPLTVGATTAGWRFDASIAGAGLFADLACHGLDLLDFLISPVRRAAGFAVNTGSAYRPEDVTAACFEFETGVVGTGIWNFNGDHAEDEITFTGSQGVLRTPVFTDGDIVVIKHHREERFPLRNPPHVHQPLIQTIVDELLGRGTCESTGVSGARTSWVMDRCLQTYY